MSWEIREADCIEAMKLMDEASVDAIVTDPPYGLEFMGKEWDRLGGGQRGKPGIGERQTDWVSHRGWNDKRCTNCGHLSHGGSPCRCDAPNFAAADDRMARMQEWHQAWATEALRVLKPGGHLLAFGGTRTYHRLACAIEDAGFEIRDSVIWVYGQGFPKSHNGEWGGTALKPSHEPIVMARKPLVGTVEENWRRHGTGALNIDGCRIGAGGHLRWSEPRDMGYHGGTDSGAVPAEESLLGRWPANVTLDESAAAELDRQSGEVGANGGRGEFRQHAWMGGWTPQDIGRSKGHASRFFYCAKASRGERNAGLWDLPGSHSTARANHHPTVKPLDLMRWLCRLVTPPGGLILDPFAGSGTTGCAAVLEDFDFLGIERESDYVEIARTRVPYWASQPKQLSLS